MRVFSQRLDAPKGRGMGNRHSWVHLGKQCYLLAEKTHELVLPLYIFETVVR